MSRRLLLRLLARAPASDHIPDAELLHRFVAANDSAAFELIVRRHADAVWSAVIRILRNESDAEDAFQATFLVLIRKAKSIRMPSVGGWLHRVAVNAALKLRERTARISLIEPQQFSTLPASPTEQSPVELAGIVHEELALLSERERLPIVLCDLEGLSHADAAKTLGWPVGTVSGRLSRARAKLRERLSRRGLTSTSALLPALSAPPHLLPNTVSLTTGVVSPTIVSLTEGVLAMTSTASWKWVLVTVVCTAALGTGGVLAFGPGVKLPVPAPAPQPVPVMATQPAAPTQEKSSDADWLPKMNEVGKLPPSVFPELLPPDNKNLKNVNDYYTKIEKSCPRLAGTKAITIEANDDPGRKILKAQLHQGVLELQRALEVLRQGSWSLNHLTSQYGTLTDMQTTVIELWSGQPKELIPWLEEIVVMTKTFEQILASRVQMGSDPPQSLNSVTRRRLSAEMALWKAKKGK